jgi:hypothetical protein
MGTSISIHIYIFSLYLEKNAGRFFVYTYFMRENRIIFCTPDFTKSFAIKILETLATQINKKISS